MLSLFFHSIVLVSQYEVEKEKKQSRTIENNLLISNGDSKFSIEHGFFISEKKEKQRS